MNIGQNMISNWVLILYGINFLIAFVVVFCERKEPSVTLVWISVLFMLPGIGAILYMFLSQNIARQKIFRMSSAEEEMLDKTLAMQVAAMEKGIFPHQKQEVYGWHDMIKLCQTYGEAYYTHDNDIDIFTDGSQMFRKLFDDIEKAKESIYIQFFIIKKDQIGLELIKLLTKKAEEGLEVRLLMDAVGSRDIWKSDLKDFVRAGAKYAFFFNNRFRAVNLKLNYRNHRKLSVIDGKIGYIGGFNVGKEYLGKKKKFRYWRDTHLRITGGSVRDINTRFILDWRSAAGDNLNIPRNPYYQERSFDLGNAGVQIVSCGPDSQKEQIKRGYMKMITSATKNVYIQTPYLVPDKSIIESLKMAAQSGVDVRIMIPCIPDHPFVYWATHANAGELVKSGCKLYIYDKGFLHAKMMVVDGQVGTVGSANFDVRSFKLNFEANAFIYDTDTAQKLESYFIKDIEDCHELTLTLYNERSILIKFKESISRLLTDLL